MIECGGGRLAEELAATGRAVTAIDLSAVLLRPALMLRKRPLDLCDVQTRNARDRARQAEAFVRDRRPTDAGSLHAPSQAVGWRPFVVGVVHGLAGSGALAVLTITALPSTSQRLLYTCVFGAGSVLGMSLLSTAASLPLSRGDRRRRVVRALGGVAGLLSTVGGLAWAIELASNFHD